MKKIKEYLLKDRTPFAEGLSFKKMFLIFVIFSFLGCLYEDVLFMAKNYINYGILDYSTKRGLLYLELSPIYGWGACIMVYILARKPRQKLDYFLIGSLINRLFNRRSLRISNKLLAGGLYRNNIMGLFNISIKYKWQNNFTIYVILGFIMLYTHG